MKLIYFCPGLNVLRSIGTILLLSCLASCASNDLTNQPDELAVTPTPYKISIVNASEEPINDIKYKPCNSRTLKYQQITGILKPQERFTINIYSQCVDLLATNAFKKKLVNVKNVDLKNIKTWTIK